MIQITEKQKREIEEKFTKYEIARILGARALQIAMNAPILIKLEKEELENIAALNPFRIAETEFYAGVLPITIKRPLPKKAEEKAVKKHIEAEEKVEEKKKEEKPLAEKEKAGKVLETKKKISDKEKPEEEAKKPELEKPEEGTLEEVEQSEIMEMATPPDEKEEETTIEEEAE